MTTIGSVLHMIPATGTVRFNTHDDTWTAPVVGYATIVRAHDHDGHETAITPVVIFDGAPVTVWELLRFELDTGTGWKVQHPDHDTEATA